MLPRLKKSIKITLYIDFLVQHRLLSLEYLIFKKIIDLLWIGVGGQTNRWQLTVIQRAFVNDKVEKKLSEAIETCRRSLERSSNEWAKNKCEIVRYVCYVWMYKLYLHEWAVYWVLIRWLGQSINQLVYLSVKEHVDGYLSQSINQSISLFICEGTNGRLP